MENLSYTTLSIPEKQLQKPFRRISDNIDFDFSSTADGWNHAKNQVDVDLAMWFRIIVLVFEKSKSKLSTRSSWPNCALRGDEAVNSIRQQCTMPLPMSIEILEILKSKNWFLANFWSKNGYFSSRWCRRAQILKWIFGFIYFVTYLQSYLQKTWRGRLRSMKFGV